MAASVVFDNSLKDPCTEKIVDMDSPFCGQAIGELTLIQVKAEITRLKGKPIQINVPGELAEIAVVGMQLLGIVHEKKSLQLVRNRLQIAKTHSRLLADILKDGLDEFDEEQLDIYLEESERGPSRSTATASATGTSSEVPMLTPINLNRE